MFFMSKKWALYKSSNYLQSIQENLKGTKIFSLIVYLKLSIIKGGGERNTTQKKDMEVTRIQGGKCVLKVRHLRKRTAKKIRRMVNLSFQKSEATGLFKTAVADRRFALCKKNRGRKSCSGYTMPLAWGYM